MKNSWLASGLCVLMVGSLAASAKEGQFTSEIGCVDFLNRALDYGGAVRFDKRVPIQDTAGNYVGAYTDAAVNHSGTIFTVVQSSAAGRRNFLFMTKDGIYSVPLGDKWNLDLWNNPKSAKNDNLSALFGSSAGYIRTYGVSLPHQGLVTVDVATDSNKDRAPLFGNGEGKTLSYSYMVFGAEPARTPEKSDLANDYVDLGKAHEGMTSDTRAAIYHKIREGIENLGDHYSQALSYGLVKNISLERFDQGARDCSSLDDPSTQKIASSVFDRVRPALVRALKQPPVSGGGFAGAPPAAVVK